MLVESTPYSRDGSIQTLIVHCFIYSTTVGEKNYAPHNHLYTILVVFFVAVKPDPPYVTAFVSEWLETRIGQIQHHHLTSVVVQQHTIQKANVLLQLE